MEYVLSNIWKSQVASRRELQTVSELWPVLHQCHMITSSMVHFIKQVQYYINFEVSPVLHLSSEINSTDELDSNLGFREEHIVAVEF